MCRNIDTFLKVRQATLNGTLAQVEIGPGDRPDVEDPCQSREPSLALRAVLSAAEGAGMMASAPAGDERPGTPPAHASFHPSRKRERGTLELAETVAELISATPDEQTPNVDREFLRNEPNAYCEPPPSTPPPIVAGTVPSTELRAGPSTQLRAGPSTELRAGPSTQLRAGPVPSSMSPAPPPSEWPALSCAEGATNLANEPPGA